MEGRGVRCGTCDYLIKIDGKGANDALAWVCACHDPECEHIREYRNADSVACKFHKCTTCGTCEYLLKLHEKDARDIWICNYSEPCSTHFGDYRNVDSVACKFHKYIDKEHDRHVFIQSLSIVPIDNDPDWYSSLLIDDEETRNKVISDLISKGYWVKCNDHVVNFNGRFSY